MCTSYWNLENLITCPNCKKKSNWNLQTHFMGDLGSCVNSYKLNRKVAELGDISVTLDGKTQSFIGSCDYCHTFVDFGAEIKKGEVIKVFVVSYDSKLIDNSKLSTS